MNMRKFLKIVSNLLLVFNAFSMLIMIVLFANGFWYLIPIVIIMIIFILKFHFATHEDEFAKYEAWRLEFSKTHEYLGVTNDYYQCNLWKNRKTGELIEL